MIKIYYGVKGQHAHLRFFSGPDQDHVGFCGSLIMAESDLDLFLSHVKDFTVIGDRVVSMEDIVNEKEGTPCEDIVGDGNPSKQAEHPMLG